MPNLTVQTRMDAPFRLFPLVGLFERTGRERGIWETIPVGTPVQVIGRNLAGSFYQVAHNGNVGWVYSDRLEIYDIGWQLPVTSY